jgi:hypothetical protein
VALVNFLISSSVERDPSQCAETKPPLVFIILLNSSKSSTLVIFLSLKPLALSKRFFWISSE